MNCITNHAKIHPISKFTILLDPCVLTLMKGEMQLRILKMLATAKVQENLWRNIILVSLTRRLQFPPRKVFLKSSCS